jgi:hypothetical protein
MNAHFENAVPNSIDGHLLQLGEGHEVAIYTRDGMCWVAEFKDGRGELFNAGTFFRFHAGVLRYSHRPYAVACASATVLTPEALERIERLHQQLEARDARMLGAGMAIVASVMRCCRALTLIFGAGRRKSRNDSLDHRRRREQPHFAGWSEHD